MSAATPKGSHGAPFLRARPVPAPNGSGTYRIYLDRDIYAVIDEVDLADVSQFAWRPSPRSDGVGHYAVRGYSITVGGCRKRGNEFMHRRIARAPKGLLVDHADGDTLNNRRSNLRVCGTHENSRNRRRNKQNPYPFKGIYSRNGYWYARIKIDGRDMHLGAHSSAVDAALAYDRAAIKYFGEFALLNFPEQEIETSKLVAGDPSLSTAVDHLPVLRIPFHLLHSVAPVSVLTIKHGGQTGCGQSRETVA